MNAQNNGPQVQHICPDTTWNLGYNCTSNK